MIVVNDLAKWPEQKKGGAVAIGVFDGVHLGHQAVISEVVARTAGSFATVLTFEPHPLITLGKEPPPFLTTFEQKCDLLASLGIDSVLAVPFTPSFAQMPPDLFASILASALGPNSVVVGEGFRYGAKGSGDIDSLRFAAKTHGFSAVAVPNVKIGATTVSSTAIRGLLQSGDLDAVERLLGRRYCVRGPVVKGFGRGKTLGFPTANVKVPEGQQLPPAGVYATLVRIGDHKFAAVSNLGTRPTFGCGEQSMEAHIIGFDGDLYGKTLDIEFSEFVRPEIRFGSPAHLMNQVQQDIARVRKTLAQTAVG